MKALLYKEFKLSMHVMCYIFIAAFPFMILIPSYPVAIGFIYVLSCYPVLFLGTNKGQQSNDLLFSTLLPVRKKDIVLARIFAVLIMQAAFMLIMTALLPVAMKIQESINVSALAEDPNAKPVEVPGLPLTAFGSIIGIAIAGFSIADLIFFSNYYKHGKSIVGSTLFTILGFLAYLGIFTIGLPYAIPQYNPTLSKPWVQFVVLGGGIIISFFMHWLTYKVSAKRLELVDF